MNNRQLSTDPNQYQGKFPYFRQPSEIGCFSHDNEHTFIHDPSSLKYLRLPQNIDEVAYDLKANYDTFIEKDSSGTFLNSLLKWIQLNESKFVATKHAGTSSNSEMNANSRWVYPISYYNHQQKCFFFLTYRSHC